MQIKGKILTIVGIVLIFGYFIVDSVKPYDPTQVVMVGNDTLGRDWGAMALQQEQAERQRAAEAQMQMEGQDGATMANPYINPYSAMVPVDQDPFSRPKFNQDNYATVESPDGREIVTGYARPEEDPDNPQYNENRIKTRHQLETGEPKMRYKD
ncbi:MAG: hypothetical protein RJA25_1716 [Bacteroidota bacterium]|mgnify:CR=1 FL=1|jgi:hypothetical protein